MEKEPYDPYYRDFSSNVVPLRTPFTRPGRHDAGRVFIYMTNKWKRWSLLLDETRASGIYVEARQHIPGGISQFWLIEKRYSTHKPRARPFGSRARANTPSSHNDAPVAVNQRLRTGKVLVVLKEPSRSYTRQGDVLSYHFEEADAIVAAETYTRQHNHRALVGLLLWDEIWL